MKKIMIYVILWILVALIWHGLNAVTDDFLRVWYLKLIYMLVGLGVIFPGGDAIYQKLGGDAK